MGRHIRAQTHHSTFQHPIDGQLGIIKLLGSSISLVLIEPHTQEGLVDGFVLHLRDELILVFGSQIGREMVRCATIRMVLYRTTLECSVWVCRIVHSHPNPDMIVQDHHHLVEYAQIGRRQVSDLISPLPTMTHHLILSLSVSTLDVKDHSTDKPSSR